LNLQQLNIQARRSYINMAAQQNPLHVVVVGAGLGGLAAAIATRQAGHNVTICEQAPALGEVCFRSLIPNSQFSIFS
jgi:NADPH-dependent 2,4-dienoyl-CoA reductase/sulfur reductase-like enzyme